MSIEGRALERDPKNPKHITKAIINNIALTFTPVNFNSYIEIAKGIQTQDFYSTDGGVDINDDVMLEVVRGGKKTIIKSDFTIRQESI